MDARTELETLALHIGALNDEKSAIVRAWEGEKVRQNDAELPKPPELIRINKQLGVFYGMKESILEKNPHLEKEFGKVKRNVLGKSPLGISPKKNKEQRKARWLANREAKRLENRARQAGKGQGKGQGKK